MLTAIVDSALSPKEILQQNPNFYCPDEVLNKIAVIDVSYYSFDGKVHNGQIAIDRDLVADVRGAFELLLSQKFPIQSVIPMADKRFGWDDNASTTANNTSGFNYRYIRDTTTLSNHALGRAIDINPRLNPYFPGAKVFPPQTSYDAEVTGTITIDSQLVQYFRDLGWQWDGDRKQDLDYQHFEKLEL